MPSKIDCFGLTDIGHRRETNQDHFLIAELSKTMRVHHSSLGIDDESRIYGGSQGKLFLVADGMGGEPEGQRASTVAIDGLTKYLLNSLEWFFRLEEHSEEDFEEELRRAVEHCENAILEVAASPSGQPSMGTTLTMVYVVWPRAFIVHVGDSRCYLLRDGRLRQLTNDHTMSKLLADREGVPEDDQRFNGMRHYLWNALGGKTGKPTIDVMRFQLGEGDTLLVSTDGLHGLVSDDAITEVLASSLNANEACRLLVDAALDQGGQDNVTAVVATFGARGGRPRQAYVEKEVPLEEAIGHPAATRAEQDTIDLGGSSPAAPSADG